MSLYEKYGGFGSINKIVMAFYDTLLDSDEIGPFFDDIEMERLIDHQTKFIATLLGGPASYTDEQLHRAHAALDITDEHFNEMKQVLVETLLAHGMEPQDTEEVMQAIESRRTAIVSAVSA